MRLPPEIEVLFDQEGTVVVTRSATEWIAQVVDVTITVPIATGPTQELYVAIPSLNVRSNGMVSAPKVGEVTYNQKLTAHQNFTTDPQGNKWRKLVSPYPNGFVAEVYNGEVYLRDTPNPNVASLAPLTGKIKIVNNRISVDGDDSPKFAVNIREAAYFGTVAYPYTSIAGLHETLNQAKQFAKWVRFYTPHKDMPMAMNISNVRMLLDAFQQHNMLGMVVLSDSIAHTPFITDPEYHTYSELGHLNYEWYTKWVWRGKYHDWVRGVVSQFKNHPAVGMWQLMNEPTIHQGRPPNNAEIGAFTAFVDETSELIYSIDTTHPISIGQISSASIAVPNFRQWIAARKYIHVVNGHTYQHKDNASNSASWEREGTIIGDFVAALETGRAVMIDEFGSAGMNSDPILSTDAFLFRTSKDVYIYGQWGFMYSPSQMDNGTGDGVYGMDNCLGPEKGSTNKLYYHQKVELYKKWLSIFGQKGD